jgi:alpha-L-rhamnosidase
MFTPRLCMNALTLATLLACPAAAAGPALDLRVGPLLQNPLGYGDANPQFTWRLPATDKGLAQTAYRIVVSSKSKTLQSAPDLWDSGKVESNQSTFVDYAGEPLSSRDRVFWAVKYWDQQGRESEWSKTAHFELGLLHNSDWTAKWIALPVEPSEEPQPAPYFRREFSLDGQKIKQARAYVTALGTFELHVNGARVGDDYFTPGWTDYQKRVHTMVYDVTPYLGGSATAIGIVLGDGWYCGKIMTNKRTRNGAYPEALLQLEITLADGTKRTIVTDESWKAKTGPILMSDHYDGEVYDARKELGAWAVPGYDDSTWQTASTRSVDNRIALTPKPNPPIRKRETLSPIAVTEPEEGKFVFDLGQNMVGWARIDIPAETGRKVTVRFAEMLNEDGTLYTENYRQARSTDTYICKGDGREQWEPHFTFHGFRYVELSGLGPDANPNASMVEGVVLYNDMEPTGRFQTSNDLLNQLQKNIVWGQRGNFFAVPTDCPQRDERCGWTGDAQVFCPTACFNYNALAFFEKWCGDIRDAQFDDGGIPWVVPDIWPQKVVPSPAWGDAGVIIPWEVYRHFGYTRILEDNYEMMAGWIRFHQNLTKDSNFIWPPDSGFGDWLQPYQDPNMDRRGDTPRRLIGTAYFARCLDIIAATADVLGKTEDAARYRDLATEVKTAFAQTFFTPDGKLNTETVETETQTSYLLALAFDLIPQEMRALALGHLKRLIVEEASGHLRTGFVGTPLICPTLAAEGEEELAFGVLLKETYPSWLFSIHQGATTMWERWNSYTKADGFGDASMNSFNHYAYGAIGEWMYEYIAGLDAALPGFREIRIAPHPGGGLTQASAKLETVYGVAQSAWQLQDNTLKLQVTVPPNTTGVVALPDGRELRVGSGEHQFTAPLSHETE